MGCCGSKDNGASVGNMAQKKQDIKLKSAQDPDGWRHVEVGKEVKISLHEHVLHLHENADFDDEQWLCNGVEIFAESGGCKHGMTEYKEK